MHVHGCGLGSCIKGVGCKAPGADVICSDSMPCVSVCVYVLAVGAISPSVFTACRMQSACMCVRWQVCMLKQENTGSCSTQFQADGVFDQQVGRCAAACAEAWESQQLLMLAV